MMREDSLSRSFDAAMAALSPFERYPRIAVGVSGGPDSMALALLASDWARARGGEIVGLTVDHGLRPESSAEAALVGQWLQEKGVDHHILLWSGPKPSAGVQAAARIARYRLMEDWCRENGVLHLATAHHRDDQAETLLSRLARGSGVDGLSSMAPSVEKGFGRLMRPLLAVPRADLERFCHECAQDFATDPSNRSEKYQRTRFRRALAEEGADAARLAQTALALSRARAVLEKETARALAECFAFHPAGFGYLDKKSFADQEDEIALRLLSSLLRTIGGRSLPFRLDRLVRGCAALRDPGFKGATLGGVALSCKGDLILCRKEARDLEGALALEAGRAVLWDGRYRIRVERPGLFVRAFGDAAKEFREKIGKTGLPNGVWSAAPAIFLGESPVFVPYLGYVGKEEKEIGPVEVVFAPRRALGPVWRSLSGLRG